MNKREKPSGLKKHRDFLIICEGDEEGDYIKRLKEIQVWGATVDVKISDSLDSIRRDFKYEYVEGDRGEHGKVVVFCDTEEPPYEQFKNMREGIRRDCHVNPDDVVFFANPNSMQIVLLHFEFVKLTHNKKSVNAPLIRKHTGVKNYEAHKKQRESVMKKIDRDNYVTMRKNIRCLGDDFEQVSSTNAGKLFEALEDGRASSENGGA